MVHAARLSGDRAYRFPRGTPPSFPSPVRLAAKSAPIVTIPCRMCVGGGAG
jgi:hypothetical protein